MLQQVFLNHSLKSKKTNFTKFKFHNFNSHQTHLIVKHQNINVLELLIDNSCTFDWITPIAFKENNFTYLLKHKTLNLSLLQSVLEQKCNLDFLDETASNALMLSLVYGQPLEISYYLSDIFTIDNDIIRLFIYNHSYIPCPLNTVNWTDPDPHLQTPLLITAFEYIKNPTVILNILYNLKDYDWNLSNTLQQTSSMLALIYIQDSFLLHFIFSQFTHNYDLRDIYNYNLTIYSIHYKKHIPTPNVSTLSSDISDVCCICIDFLQKNQEIYTLPCSHFFHLHCYLKWSETCPICRY